MKNGVMVCVGYRAYLMSSQNMSANKTPGNPACTILCDTIRQLRLIMPNNMSAYLRISKLLPFKQLSGNKIAGKSPKQQHRQIELYAP